MKKRKEHHNKSNSKIRILIVDDHTVVRQGLILLINQEPDLKVCAEAENASQALEVIKKQQFDLAIVDISLDGPNGIQLTERIKAQQPHLPVLVLTMHDEELYIKRAFQAGAKGYVTKHEAAETIITAIRLMLSGKDYISKAMTQKFLRKLNSKRSHG
jgi:DNA-binding NarL/FixJ family response regulator